MEGSFISTFFGKGKQKKKKRKQRKERDLFIKLYFCFKKILSPLPTKNKLI